MILLILSAAFLVNTSLAQQGSNFTDIDKDTYDLYLRGSWRELTAVGEKALKQGVDYYYLRMRLGIAGYELKDYSGAISHFKKALEFNSADDLAKEYLYFAYKFYGREMEAHQVAQSFSRTLINKLSYNNDRGIRSLSLNAARSFIQDHNIIDSYSIEIDPGIKGFQSVTDNFMFFGGSLESRTGNFITFNHSIGYLSKSYMLYLQDEDDPELRMDQRLSQFQYYLSGRMLLGNGTFLIPAIHYLNLRIPYYTMVGGRGGSSFIVKQHYFQHDFASSLTLEKYIRKVKPALSTGYSNINGQKQVQGSFALSWFPLGNLNLYTISEITWYRVLRGVGAGDYVFSQDFGLRLFTGLWVELTGKWGNMENFAGSRAYYVYNDTGLTREQYGINMIVPFFNRGFELSAQYSFNRQESRFITGNDSRDIPLNPIEMNTHKISGGIKWKF